MEELLDILLLSTWCSSTSRFVCICHDIHALHICAVTAASIILDGAFFPLTIFVFFSLSRYLYTTKRRSSSIRNFFFFFSFSSFVSLTLAVWFIESPTEYEIISYKHSLSTVFFSSSFLSLRSAHFHRKWFLVSLFPFFSVSSSRCYRVLRFTRRWACFSLFENKACHNIRTFLLAAQQRQGGGGGGEGEKMEDENVCVCMSCLMWMSKHSIFSTRTR